MGEMGGVQQGDFPKSHPPSYQPRREPMSRSMQVAYKAFVKEFLQTNLLLVYLFFCERKAVPVQ